MLTLTANNKITFNGLYIDPMNRLSTDRLTDDNELLLSSKIELTALIRKACNRLTGFEPNYVTVGNGESIEGITQLKQWRSENGIHGCMPVLENGNTASIYGPELNELFRYWHDLTHLQLDAGFDEIGETKVALAQVHQLRGLGASEFLQAAVFCDTYGQTRYYRRTKKFIVVDGARFVYEALLDFDYTIGTFNEVETL